MRSLLRLHTSMLRTALLLIIFTLPAFAQAVPDAPSPLANTPYAGSVVSTPVTPDNIPLTITDAIDRGLRYNLGLLLSVDATEASRAARLRALSDLMPQLNGRVVGTSQQIDLAAFGFTPSPGNPSVVGPFSLFDVRATVTSPVIDLKLLNRSRAATENMKAAKSSMADSREIVVLVIADSYLRVLADAARVEATKSEVATAEAFYQQSTDMKKAGTVPGIDVLRAQVDLEARKQKLLTYQNTYAKNKLALARIIGLPAAQSYTLTDKMPTSTPHAPLPIEMVVGDALRQRADYLSAQSALRVAELNRKAAQDGNLPSLGVTADYGVIGQSPSSSHGTFSATGTLSIPLYNGGRVKSEVLAAETAIHQRQSELKNLEQQIEVEVRNAYLDIETTSQQVEVARSAVVLANQQLTQAKDRFASGVGTSIELLQAEQAVADANENVIQSLYANNIAKASLARAAGAAERTIRDFLGGQK
jgi:outer membrane protein TolC